MPSVAWISSSARQLYQRMCLRMMRAGEMPSATADSMKLRCLSISILPFTSIATVGAAVRPSTTMMV